MLTARSFLVRGLLAGLIAGVLTFAVAYFVGEPSVAGAIAIEEAASSESVDTAAAEETADHDHEVAADGTVAEHSHGEDAEVSRSTQSTWGLATATIVFGVALGGILGLASAFAAGRLGRLSVRASTMVVTAVGFGAVYLVPYLKYPPNPPAVGNPDTIGDRTSMYFVMLAVSVIVAIVAVVVARRLARTMDSWNATLLATAGYGVIVGLVAWLLPMFDEVPVGFPGDLLWEFRIASLTVQTTMWLAAGLVLAALIHSVYRRAASGHTSNPVLSGTSA